MIDQAIHTISIQSIQEQHGRCSTMVFDKHLCKANVSEQNQISQSQMHFVDHSSTFRNTINYAEVLQRLIFPTVRQ
jgi:hypothetical protein